MTLDELLPPYLARQRWFAGEPPEKVGVVDQDWLGERLQWLIIDAAGARYQVVVGYVDGGDPPEFLHGQESAVLGDVDGRLAFDAVLDGELAKALLRQVAPDQEAELVRPMGVEQSNTSLVFDDRLVLKLFRRLHDGPNPDVEVTERLWKSGFTNVAAPLATWTLGPVHLAVVQPFLSGAAEGWALAQTSLRDFYASACEDPAECGGDFAPEAARLGEVTARMHLALADAFGTEPGDSAAWHAMARSQLDRLDAADADRQAAEAFLARLARVTEPGPAVRVHGDYHLAQVVQTDTGWYVLDFEGEPARPLAERTRPTSVFKDVAGMLRSFHYASRVALNDRDDLERDSLSGAAARWEQRSRSSFLEAYFAVDGVDALLPASAAARDALLAAFELDKAVYEVLYERAHRPAWVEIPRGAVRRLLAG